MNKAILNVTIKSTMLGVEDHGIFTSSLYLEGDGWGTNFGGFRLDEFDKIARVCRGSAYGMEYIMRLLKTVGVDKWESLPGVRCRVRFDSEEGWGGRVEAIGHWCKDDLWFDPKAMYDELYAKEVV